MQCLAHCVHISINGLYLCSSLLPSELHSPSLNSWIGLPTAEPRQKIQTLKYYTNQKKPWTGTQIKKVELQSYRAIFCV